MSHVDSVLATLRVMVGIADATVAETTSELTLTQFRALRIVVERTPVTMGVVARELAINASSVTRACERLVTLGLLQRARNPLNKREVLLAPTVAGRRMANRVDQARRAALAAVLDRLDPDTRSTVVTAFERFTAAVESAPIPHGATV